jgi:hypothetical protein
LHFYGKPRHPAATRFKRCKQLLGIPPWVEVKRVTSKINSIELHPIMCGHLYQQIEWVDRLCMCVGQGGGDRDQSC